ncbi:nucleoside triphosphate pyrophosphohydrolase ham1 [Entophlyctis luteolus]|nr:nucleoside triphosphate pyrophosphohydrolase ham1 [Entophlyctis luteolus]KAJ3347369.1 nucleoside triphosphate pyrophosphohydrolase ham1 [Entophlyctis luteolus]
MRTITFVTGNANKLAEVQAILAATAPALSIVSRSLDVPELQGATTQEVTRSKCQSAAELVQGPVLVEDTALCFNALNGLPGPYIKWFLSSVGHEGLNRMLDGFDDRGADAVCTFAYTAGPGEDVRLFEGRTPGRIVAARGPSIFGWDPVFEPVGFSQTYAEMDKSVKNEISHRARALAKVREFFGQTQPE